MDCFVNKKMPRRPVCILKVGKILRNNPKRCKFESISELVFQLIVMHYYQFIVNEIMEGPIIFHIYFCVCGGGGGK